MKKRKEGEKKKLDPIHTSLFAFSGHFPMLPSKDAAGAADDPPLSATELSQAFERAQEQRSREEDQQEGDGGEEKNETSGESSVGLDLDRREGGSEKRRGGGEGRRWKRALLRCFCGGR